ncbi:MAG: hypothetical protein PVI91_04820 [Gammaproteobacteria bacterium]
MLTELCRRYSSREEERTSLARGAGVKLPLRMFELPSVFVAWRDAQRLSLEQRTALQEQVEGVVDGVEPKMRLVWGYRKKLQPAVAIARSYIDELVEQIPGPLDVSPKTFVSDPQVNAFFASPQEVREVFSASSELRAFFDQPGNADLESPCALLCMVEREKTVFGMELVQDRVRRDVTQTAVNFSDHKVLTPGATDTDARQGLKDCIFNALVSHALQHIADLKAHKRDLQDQRRILYGRLRARQAYNGGLDTLLASASSDPPEILDIEERLADAEQRLSRIPAARDAPRDYLHEVKAILERPEDFIRLRRVSFRLTRMSIKAAANCAEPAHSVELAEISVANVLKRVVVIVCYPRSEMLPPKGPLRLL